MVPTFYFYYTCIILPILVILLIIKQKKFGTFNTGTIDKYTFRTRTQNGHRSSSIDIKGVIILFEKSKRLKDFVEYIP